MNVYHILGATIIAMGGLVGGAAPVVADVVKMLPQNTRVVPYHVYEDRQQARDVVTPRGYRRVWDDDRLNPQRGITTLKPTGSGAYAVVPPGYKPAWNDNRLNPTRGQGTAFGAAQTDRVWRQTVPRVPMPVAAPQRLYDGPTPRKQQKTPLWETR
ncbi:hypothetical protein [Sedimentitalea todarodis]|uniref:Uncharacterized protein n=1 Tax=Sedimentitalea todarodis TaxID=1631240 RepID=A0ABU3VD27_9RHOB|nr:hypothetical protein [Sedimentitalea todarodis]MDU9003988.1 hypothetical protein [Sedimentitalea todarodis]